MTDYGPALEHYRNVLGEALGINPERISLVPLAGAGSGGGTSEPPSTSYDEIPDPYGWMEHHLREAAYHITLVQLYKEYGHADQSVLFDSDLQEEVLDQAVRLIAFVAEQWDSVFSWSLDYENMLAEVESESEEEWQEGGMDWPDDD